MSTLLIELLTEELPPKALARLGEAFAQSLFDGLSSQGLLEDGASVEGFATPRRLAASISGVRRTAPDRELREKVLPVNIAFDAEGKPAAPLTKKLAALAKSVGVEAIAPESLERAPDGKAESLFYRYTARGAVLADGLQTALSQTIANLPIPKVMTYQRPDGDNVQFVRPAHKLIALLGNEVIPVSVLGLQSGNVTLGHRFLSAGEIVITDATSYAGALESQGKVIASYAKRREAIRAELHQVSVQIVSLMAPYLRGRSRALFDDLVSGRLPQREFYDYLPPRDGGATRNEPKDI